MRFISTATAVLALAVSAFAQTADFDPITSPAKNEKIPAGETFTIKWTVPDKYAADTVKISLIGGATQNTQVPLMDLASGVANSAATFAWPVDASLGEKKFYGLTITSEQNPDVFQYSNPFSISSSSDGGDDTTTITKTQGTKTVHLSTCTTSSSTSTSTSTKHTHTHTTFSHNSTTSISTKTKSTKHTTITMVPTSTIMTTTAPPMTTTAPTTVPTETTGAAPRVGAGSLALVGGLAVALFAL